MIHQARSRPFVEVPLVGVGAVDGDTVGAGLVGAMTGDTDGARVVGAMTGDTVVTVTGAAVGGASTVGGVDVAAMLPLKAMLKVPASLKPLTPVTKMLYCIPATVVKVRSAAKPEPSLLLTQAGKLHWPEKATSFALKVASLTWMSTVPSSPMNVYHTPLLVGAMEQVRAVKSVKAPVESPTLEKGLDGTSIAVSQLSFGGRLSSDTPRLNVPASLNPEIPVTSKVYSVLAAPAQDKKLPKLEPSLLEKQLGT
jgi:hypothetical protein